VTDIADKRITRDRNCDKNVPCDGNSTFFVTVTTNEPYIPRYAINAIQPDRVRFPLSLP
jgi:hypothetical protein